MVPIEHFIVYGNKKLPYTLITSKKLKNLYIVIDPCLGVVVKNPNFSLKKVQLLVEKKTSWIAQKLLLVEQKKLISNTYKYKNKVLLYGKEESLHVEGKLADFYKQKTQSIALPLVSKWSQKMGLMPTKVLFRKTKKDGEVVVLQMS